MQHCYCAFQIVASRTGWARVGTITTWVDEVLRPYANGRPLHLVMDQYLAHVHQAVADAVEGIGGGGVQYVPGGCTSVVQPLDVLVMRSFQSRLRAIWKAWKVGHTDDDGNCDSITRQEVVRMISLAWEHIPVARIRMEGSRTCSQISRGD